MKRQSQCGNMKPFVPQQSPTEQVVQAVRDKVVSNLASSLDKAATELKKEGHRQGLPDATAVARAVEQALQKHFGRPAQHALPMSAVHA